MSRLAMIEVDGSMGEGGGQILRTSLALSLVTGRPLRIGAIRKGRARPGLMRQHLTAVQAAAEIGRAEVSGASVGSLELEFRPREVVAGDYQFRIGTAGSTTLVLQTVLPALLAAKAPSTLVLEGGTHNPLAPPFDFLARSFLPLLGRMGPQVAVSLERPGFYPAGGGRIRVAIEPAALSPLELPRRGEIRERRVVASVAHLPGSIAARELAAARVVLGWESACFQQRSLVGVEGGAVGPGNVVTIDVECEHVTAVFTGFGEVKVRAEDVASRAARAAAAWLESEVAVDEHLADQLLLPMALAGRGAFTTVAPTGHTKTQAALLRQLLGAQVAIERVSERAWQIEVSA